jgi:hypothetical protein
VVGLEKREEKVEKVLLRNGAKVKETDPFLFDSPYQKVLGLELLLPHAGPRLEERGRRGQRLGW